MIHEIRSESTLPLLNFLLTAGPNQSTQKVAIVLHQVTADIGKQDPPIPDESEQDRTRLLKLIKDGPGTVEGHPKASFVSSILYIGY